MQALAAEMHRRDAQHDAAAAQREAVVRAERERAGGLEAQVSTRSIPLRGDGSGAASTAHNGGACLYILSFREWGFLTCICVYRL